MIMDKVLPKDTALLVHIEHSKPVEINNFVSSLNALNSLYTSYIRKYGDSKEVSQSKLYIEKIEEGSIDIFLCELAAATLIPFIENANVIFDFAAHIKSIYDFFIKGKGEKPTLDIQECKNYKDVLGIVSSDFHGTMSIGAINRSDKGHVFNNCIFNYGDSNSAQNKLDKNIEELKEKEPKAEIYCRVLMHIYQLRNESSNDVGNKAIIDEIAPGKKVSLLFDSDELKSAILFSETNPTQKGFQVDVKVQTINGKLSAYKVVALHDIIDLEE